MPRHIESFKPIQLPSKLAKQFTKDGSDDDEDLDDSRFKNLPGYRDKSKKTLTRKEQRKKDREDKKKRKDEFYRSRGNNNNNNNDNNNINKKQRLDENGSSKKIQQQQQQQQQQQPKQPKQQQPKQQSNKVEKIQNKLKQSEINEQKKLAFLKSIGRNASDLMSSDDKEIAMLEKKLGLNKNKKNKNDEDDGLGEFMNDPIKKKSQQKQLKKTNKFEIDEDGEEELPEEENDDPSYIDDIFDDLEKALAGGYSDEDEEYGDDNDEGSYNYDDDLDGEFDGNDEDDEDQEDEEDEEGDGGDDDDQEEEGDENGEDDEDDEDEDKYYKEDIYGRVIDTRTGDIIKDNKGVGEGSAPSNKYVPPHLRNQQSNSTNSSIPTNKKSEILEIEVDPILKRKINGLMNKLAVNNFYAIFNEIVELFDNNPRNSMKQVLTQLIINNCSESTQIVHSMIHINTALVSGLHSMIGTDIGGHIVEAIFKEYNRVYNDQSSTSSLVSNYLLLFIHLYNFQVIGSKIIFDMAKNYIDSFKDIDVQLLLLLIQNAGYQLRGEDPATLKDIILIVQKKQQEYKLKRQEEILNNNNNNGGDNQTNKLTLEEIEKSNKLTFMMDTISNLKNNKIKNTKLIDQLMALKKAIKSVLKSRELSMNNNQMKISWDDLVNVESKGRWWLVGSSWAGNDVNPLLGITSKAAHLQKSMDSGISLKTYENNSALLKLAIANKMNTDLRKTIFCILMTSEDFSDAFDKIMELKLKDKQDREVIHVLMHCCLKEKKFNPYYYHLAHRLCIHDNNFKFTLQYCIWDHLKELQESSSSIDIIRVSNLSQLLGKLIENHVFSLTILRVTDLNQQLQPIEIVFFRLLFTYLLTLPDESSVSTIFERLITSTQSRISATKESQTNALSLTKGIGLFFVHGLLSNNSKSDPNYTLLKERIKFVKKLLKSNDTILL